MGLLWYDGTHMVSGVLRALDLGSTPSFLFFSSDSLSSLILKMEKVTLISLNVKINDLHNSTVSATQGVVYRKDHLIKLNENAHLLWVEMYNSIIIITLKMI